MPANSGQPTIEVRLPASPELVALLRYIAGAAAARADLTIDLLDDTKIACSEAAILLIQHGIPHADFMWTWTCTPGSVQVCASAPTKVTDVPNFAEMEGFTWTVLSSVAQDLSVRVVDSHLVITFSIFEAN